MGDDILSKQILLNNSDINLVYNKILNYFNDKYPILNEEKPTKITYSMIGQRYIGEAYHPYLIIELSKLNDEITVIITMKINPSQLQLKTFLDRRKYFNELVLNLWTYLGASYKDINILRNSIYDKKYEKEEHKKHVIINSIILIILIIFNYLLKSQNNENFSVSILIFVSFISLLYSTYNLIAIENKK